MAAEAASTISTRDPAVLSGWSHRKLRRSRSEIDPGQESIPRRAQAERPNASLTIASESPRRQHQATCPPATAPLRRNRAARRSEWRLPLSQQAKPDGAVDTSVV